MRPIVHYNIVSMVIVDPPVLPMRRAAEGWLVIRELKTRFRGRANFVLIIQN